jgi:general secretion pathway protein A
VYSTWFGFREKPFNLTPDPKYLYLSHRHAEAFAHLEFGHKERGGFVLITGEVGTGKTTLARYFLSKLDSDTHSAFVLYPALSAEELLKTILDDLHVTPEGESKKSLVDALHRFLLETRAAGRNVVLLIDEAQDLPPEVLEQIRLISNLETDTEKLLQIVLTGQPELKHKLASVQLRQLRQRIAIEHHVKPLGRNEVGPFLAHRIQVAGGRYEEVFAQGVEPIFYSFSGGIPRLLCLLADRALLAAFARQLRPVPLALVEAKAKEMEEVRASQELGEGGG